MLRIINKYSHGFTLVPVVSGLRDSGALDMLAGGPPVSLKDMAESLGCSDGYLGACLDMLAVLGWVESGDGGFGPGAAFSQADFVPEGMMPLYDYRPTELVRGDGAQGRFGAWLENVVSGWGCEEPLSIMLDGVVLMPLLLGLTRAKLVESLVAGDETALPLCRIMREVFVARRWATHGEEGFAIGGVGKFMLGRCMNMGVTASYRPMLRALPALLRGDLAVFGPDENGHEGHIDRALNVQSSGFQHERYFADMKAAVIELFDTEEVADQPDYIADMGCGDGSLLRTLYETVRDHTARGRMLADHPLTVVGLDYNEKALAEAGRTLTGIPALLLHGDVGRPGDIPANLKARGVEDVSRVLHVRSFLDHNRPFNQPVDRAGVALRERLPLMDGGIGPGGEFLTPAQCMQSLVEHLGRWRSVFGEYGLLCLEVHSQSRWAKRTYLDMAEGLHFDVLHRFSRQYPCAPEVFFAAMAENGLFPAEGLRAYPRGLPYTRIVLGHYHARPYNVRPGEEGDATASAAMTQWCSRADNGVDRAWDVTLVQEGRVLGTLGCGEIRGEEGEALVIGSLFARDRESATVLFDYARTYAVLRDGIAELRGLAHASLSDWLEAGGATVQVSEGRASFSLGTNH